LIFCSAFCRCILPFQIQKLMNFLIFRNFVKFFRNFFLITKSLVN